MKIIALALLPLATIITACTVEHTVYDPPRTTEYNTYAIEPGAPTVYNHTTVEPDGSSVEYHRVVQPYTKTEYHHVETSGPVSGAPQISDDEAYDQ